MQNIADRIEDIRLDKDVSQKDFIKDFIITESQYSKYKTCLQPFPTKTILDIADKYNINLIWLFKGQGQMYENPTNDEEFNILIGYINEQIANSAFTKKLLLKTVLSTLIEKIIEKKGFFIGENNRVIFLLMEILNDISQKDDEIMDPLGYLEKAILDIQDIKQSSRMWENIMYANNSEQNCKHLLYKIKKLNDAEAKILVMFAEEVIIILNKRFNNFIKFLFMPKYIIK